jgi:hypothetical protein
MMGDGKGKVHVLVVGSAGFKALQLFSSSGAGNERPSKDQQQQQQQAADNPSWKLAMGIHSDLVRVWKAADGCTI